MGLSFSCPIGNLDDLDNHLESILSKSLSFKENDVKTLLRSISFDDHRYFKPNKMIRGSLSFNGRELDRVSSLKCSSAKEYYRAPKETLESPSLERKISGFEPLEPEPKPRGPESPLTKPVMNRDVAAVKLQKTYKSFRTRRQLADCAVLAEQRWWKLLDFAVLKCTSVSFFEDDKPETAVARWSRARTRAAKVGKGLSKNEKARKLALQHWLEAIDPRHRYGHNLQFYYATWLHCQSRQPFFYWLDVGEGKEVNLERCSRQKLQQQCIKYLDPIEREAYEVTVEDGKFTYSMSKNLIDTRNGPDDAKWIFVLSTSMVLYVGMKQKGKFQHSSFLAGGATLSAGRLVIIDGILKAVWPHSGHYLPTEENFDAFISFLEQHHVDLDAVKKSPDDEDEFSTEMPGFGLRNSVSEPEIFQNTKKHAFKKTKQGDLMSNITTLEIPKNNNIISAFQNKASEPEPDPDSASDYDTAEEFLSDFDTAEEFLSDFEFMVSKRNLFDYGEEDEANDESVPHEKILQRINSHKETKSFQLGKQLSFKWTTGAGPRIGCVRDYPLEIQVCAMEEACLSPKGSFMSPRKFGGEMSGPMKKKVEKSPLFSEN